MSSRSPGRSLLAVIAALVVLSALALFGCQNRLEKPTAPAPLGEFETTRGSQSGDPCAAPTPFDSRQFPSTPRINTPWFPLVPGTEFTYEGRAERGGAILPHRVVFIVTDLTKKIDGVRTVMVWDRDFSNGQMVEAELAFHAQDRAGNVWALGEYPEQYDDSGQFTGAPSTWIAGVSDAIPGILVVGDPHTGDKFLQGSVPSIGFLDCAKVYMVGQSTCVPTGCYDNVTVISERSPLEGGGTGHQLKYYAPRTGLVQIGAVGDKENETLVLVSLRHLNAAGIAEARAAALKLEKHAYQVSDVYAQTEPAR